MTSTPVTDVSTNLFQVTSNKSTDYSTGTGFDQVMNSNTNSKKETTDVKDTKYSQPTRVERRKEDVVREAAEDNSVETPKEIASEEIKDDVTDAAKEIVEKVADELDVSEEKVTQAMESLGLTMMDLFQPENLKALVTEIAAEGNSIALMTNEDLYASLQNLIQFAKNEITTLASENGLTEEELGKVLEYMNQENNGMKEILPAEQNISEVGENQSASLATMEPEKSVTSQTELSDDNLQETKSEMDSEPQNHMELKKATDNMEEETHSSEEEQSSEHKDTKNFQMNLVQNTPSNTGLNPDGDIQIPQESFRSTYPNADGLDIIRQITDYMNLQNKENLTQMELQLHPASLGTINLTVTSKAGVITASIEAQNEAVKNALETQVITLRENLENQGVKVEAVEVTVASHEFERNLNQGNENNQTEDDTVGKSAKARQIRRINLEEESAEELEGDEEITLAKEVMKMNGNTVDYTV